MALPKIQQPIYEVKLMSRKEPVRFRPFLVKEHKLLMMALETKNSVDILRAVKQVISNCCVDAIDIDDLPSVDLEMLFVNLRARSIGEVLELKYKCKNNVLGESVCGRPFSVGIDMINDVQISQQKMETKIALSDSIGVIMKLPATRDVERFALSDMEDEDKELHLAASCIEGVYDEDGLHAASESTIEELVDWVASLNDKQFGELEKFFKTTPTIFAEKQHTCVACGYEHKIRVEGLSDFFM